MITFRLPADTLLPLYDIYHHIAVHTVLFNFINTFPPPILYSSGCSCIYLRYSLCKYIMIMPVSLKNRDSILQFYNVPSFHHLLLFAHKTLSKRHWRYQVFEEGKSKIEPWTAPVCLTLFNEAPTVRHRGLNPPHSNM